MLAISILVPTPSVQATILGFLISFGILILFVILTNTLKIGKADPYDRLINKLIKKKNFLKIGLAFSKQLINNLPVSKHDRKMDYVVTEKFVLQ